MLFWGMVGLVSVVFLIMFSTGFVGVWYKNLN